MKTINYNPIKPLLLLSLVIVIWSCNNTGNNSAQTDASVPGKSTIEPKSKKDTIDIKLPEMYEIVKKDKTKLSDMFEIVSVETGMYNERFPQVKVKFRNISGVPIDGAISVKYQFIENDEIFFDSHLYIHNSFDVEWENGLVKTEVFRSHKGYSISGTTHHFKAKLKFEDNSLIWEGNISNTPRYGY